jgi:hypothetical protein
MKRWHRWIGSLEPTTEARHMTKERDRDPEEQATEELRARMRIMAGNIARGAGLDAVSVGGVLLLAETRLGELLDGRAALLRSVAKAVRVEVPEDDEDDEPKAPTSKDKHRHKFEGEPPTCTVCGKPKSAGGRKPKPDEGASARDPVFETTTDPPNHELPIVAAPATPAPAAKQAKVIGDKAADKYTAGPV